MKTTLPSINQILLPYAALLALLCIFAQVVTAARGNGIDLAAGLALVPACMYYLYFNYRNKSQLAKIRFGVLVTHFITFLVVNLSYHIHVAVLALQNATDSHGPAISLSDGWFGALIGMFVIWGAGLLVHTVISIAQKGYEDLEA